MNSNIKFWFLLVGLILMSGGGMSKTLAQMGERYEASWESLSKHNEAPEWFKDAKLGIYFHWGVYSVPAFGSEWYPRNMYRPSRKEFKHHLETYGRQSEFGYHDFVPMFKAENFDAEEWVDLFQKAGARFAGPVAEHHDGFSMWDSKVNPWNAKNMGPKRDITGELAKAIRKRGMKLITTFHHARLLQRGTNLDDPGGSEHYNSHYPYNKNYATSSTDPELRLLYGNIPPDQFHKQWQQKLTEVIEGYQPDIIWFDSWFNLIPEKTSQEFCRNYLNHALDWDKEVVIAYKQTDLPKTVGVNDIEKGGKSDRTDESWLTDDTISLGSWCYTENLKIKPAKMVLQNFIDIVSKNGVLLLNVSPKADGTIPDNQREVLLKIGEWLSKYGEAIYETRAWEVYGFGPTTAAAGRHGGVRTTSIFTSEDIRFTISKDRRALYVIFLGKPEPGARIELRSFGVHRYPTPTPIKRITLLGTDIEAEGELTDQSFYLTIPEGPMDEIATVFKMKLED